ncbi:hypothetical protein RN001_011869 [Aquatica leii]|uniref:SAM-dependent MTase RsmB/NOP-type domain-containing protein n=1 Tax=Aquatica leii TaxID=1421715 RepID=A0AAN7SD17_9COLE|nr:hypothetical protein RN001_011869 [Aquatica leii]
MPYPNSPFSEKMEKLILQNNLNNCDDEIQNQVYLEKTLKWLCTWPKITSLRVNTTTHTVDDVIKLIEEEVRKITPHDPPPKIEVHSLFSDVVILHNQMTKYLNLNKEINEVIVDVHCAASVLRGAHIFAPGVIGMLPGAAIGDRVSVYADLLGQCKKGFNKIYNYSEKLFLGNGVIKMTRRDLFGNDLVLSGVAVEVTDRISGCLSVNENLFPIGSVLLQNIPSSICIHALKIEPDLTILDMCASPGNKTTHIAALMTNKGTLVAIDKTPSKVKVLKETCDKYKAKVHVFEANSTKLLDKESKISKWCPDDGAFFPACMFDRILLDAPCSSLGKRPQLSNKISEAVLKSYVPLQRKLFNTAVCLLKPNGYLLYSTCTIALAENEGIVAWAIKNYDCLELVKPDPYLGEPGLLGTTLTEAQRNRVQRFGPDQDIDSVGFFFALFIKIR